MVKARDELVMLQGSLNAAKDAVADRQKAADELVAAQTEADTLRVAARAIRDAAIRQKKELDEREAALDVERQQFNIAVANRTAELDKRYERLNSDGMALAAEQDKITVDRARLDSDRETFEARVKTFQEKIASMSL
jgi:DNA repair exonuclease SbcCD ATPase subunit